MIKEQYSLLNSLKPKKLSDFATILPQISFVQDSSDFNIAGIPYITFQNIQNSELIWDDINEYINPPNQYVKNNSIQKYLRRFLKVGDIIIPQLDNLDNIYLVKEEDLPAIAGQQLTVIRSAGISSQLLFAYINSSSGKESINQQLSILSKDIKNKELCLKNVLFPTIQLLSLSQMEELYSKNIEEIRTVTNEFTTPKPSNNLDKFSTSLERNLYSVLLANGWQEEAIVIESRDGFIIDESKKTRFIPDFLLKDGNKNIAIMECKLSSHLDNINRIKEKLLSITETYNLLFILTNGEYFEIYKKRTIEPMKIFHVPTKEELLSFLYKGDDKNE